MMDILSVQHIRPRRKPAWKQNKKLSQRSSFPKIAFRPKGVVYRAKNNSSLMELFRQKPVHTRHGHSQSDASRESKPFSFAFSMPLVPALCVLVLCTILIANNWDRIFSSWIHRNVVPLSSLEDSGLELNMASYAGINPQETITPAANPDTAASPAGAPETVSEELRDEPIPLNMVEYLAWENYRVKKGDSVSKIAKDHGLSLDAVIASNNLSNAHLLREGDMLRLPNMDGIPYTVKKGDTLSKISKTWNVPLEAIVDANDIQRDSINAGQNIFLPGARMPATDLKLALGTLFVSPLKGMGARLSSPYGWRKDPISGAQRFHEALDLAANQGTAVKAAAPGKVASVGFNSLYGNFIILSHSDSFQTLYAHLSVVSVKQGQAIEQGTKIGEVGTTGYSTGPHLHFALYKNGRAINPLDYLVL